MRSKTPVSFIILDRANVYKLRLTSSLPCI